MPKAHSMNEILRIRLAKLGSRPELILREGGILGLRSDVRLCPVSVYLEMHFLGYEALSTSRACLLRSPGGAVLYRADTPAPVAGFIENFDRGGFAHLSAVRPLTRTG